MNHQHNRPGGLQARHCSKSGTAPADIDQLDAQSTVFHKEVITLKQYPDYYISLLDNRTV